ncbi:MAG: gluconate 2-dehydrogenase subunit 3 family protein [Campylobacterota bacterium]|nr:gluconate 2-dehydrogenase subunit 3 family protein [Campylobacterota bacterium]
MDRRVFLAAGFMSGVSTLLMSEESPAGKGLSEDNYFLIEAVQQHMFPGGNGAPSAKEFQATRFLEEAIVHPSYDRDIREFIFRGAEKLRQREKGLFLTYDKKEKEQALRAFEQTSLGSGWLDRIMILSLEGLLSDPIYGGNVRQSGWKALQTKGGEPRPSTRYIEL